MSNIVVGDLVEFIEYEKANKWESNYGLDIGDVVRVTFSEGESLWVLSKTGKLVSVCASRVFKCVEDGENKVESKLYNPLIAQEGGGHYKNRGIQPIEYSEANNLGACQHSVVKYITRHQDKNGIEDLSKIIHFTFLEAFFKYGEQGSTELKEKVLKLLGEHG